MACQGLLRRQGGRKGSSRPGSTRRRRHLAPRSRHARRHRRGPRLLAQRPAHVRSGQGGARRGFVRAGRRAQRTRAVRCHAGSGRRGRARAPRRPPRGRRVLANAPRSLPRHGGRRDFAGRRRVRGVGDPRARGAQARSMQRVRPVRRAGRSTALASVALSCSRRSKRQPRCAGRSSRPRPSATTSGWEALRLERAVPSFGVDFDEKTYPQEAALEKVAVSFDKGCYLGQEVVCMLELRGHVKRKLAALVLDAEGSGLPPSRGAPVNDGQGGTVGEVTSAAMSPTLGQGRRSRDAQACGERTRSSAADRRGARSGGRAAGVGEPTGSVVVHRR